jgi:hypothetical protein
VIIVNPVTPSEKKQYDSALFRKKKMVQLKKKRV